jgi:hypothetical protein
VLYTALEAVPTVGPVLGNIVNTIINVAVSGTGIHDKISPSPFLVAYSELWNELTKNFQVMLEAAGAVEPTSLSDWGKLQATSTAITSNGPDSLKWLPGTTAELVTASTPGYEISVLQVLLPAKYQIYWFQDSDSDAVSGVPDYCQWVEPAGAGKWNKYWIATNQAWNVYPTQQAMQNDVWGNKVSTADFYKGYRGWNFPIAWAYPERVPTGDSTCNWLTVRVANQTPDLLKVTQTAQEGTVVNPTSLTIPPYESVSLCSYYNGGLRTLVQIYDLNLPNSPLIASFLTHQHHCVMEAGDVWVDTTWSDANHSLSAATCNPGAYGKGYSGAIQVTVYPK